jgi:hypothetical protein
MMARLSINNNGQRRVSQFSAEFKSFSFMSFITTQDYEQGLVRLLTGKHLAAIID